MKVECKHENTILANFGRAEKCQDCGMVRRYGYLLGPSLAAGSNVRGPEGEWFKLKNNYSLWDVMGNMKPVFK